MLLSALEGSSADVIDNLQGEGSSSEVKDANEACATTIAGECESDEEKELFGIPVSVISSVAYPRPEMQRFFDERMLPHEQLYHLLLD